MVNAFDADAPVPEDATILGTKFVLVLKTTFDQELQKTVVDKYRIRVTALGYAQIFGVNYSDTFAPTAQLVTSRVIYHLTLRYDLTIYGMDVKQAYLQARADPRYPLYIRLPEEMTYRGKNVLKCLGNLEGTKQGAHGWYHEQDAFLRSFDPDLSKSPVDPCLYFKVETNFMVLILVHTDDYLIATNSQDYWKSLTDAFQAKYGITTTTNVPKYCGVFLEHSKDTISLHQISTIDKLLKEYNLEQAASKDSPEAPGTDLPDDTERDEMLPFRELVGSLLWIARNTRPDILHSVLYHAQFTHCYSSVHFKSLKRVLLYLSGTKHYKLVFRKPTSDKASCNVYTDSDWGGCKLDRKSWMGSLVQLDGENAVG